MLGSYFNDFPNEPLIFFYFCCNVCLSSLVYSINGPVNAKNIYNKLAFIQQLTRIFEYNF